MLGTADCAKPCSEVLKASSGDWQKQELSAVQPSDEESDVFDSSVCKKDMSVKIPVWI